MTNQQWDVLFYNFPRIAHFIVTCENEAGVDLLLIQPFLLYYVNHVVLSLTSIFQAKFSLQREGSLYQNKSALAASFSLACLEIRSRNEEAINSTRNRIYSLKVFYFYVIDCETFYLFLNWFSSCVSDAQKYVCGRKLYACVYTRRFKDLDSREIT